VNSIGSHQDDSVNILPFEESLVTYFLITPVLFAERFAFLGCSCEAGRQFNLLAFHYRIGNGICPIPQPNETQPSYFPFIHPDNLPIPFFSIHLEKLNSNQYEEPSPIDLG
jgi:hypothetical protein